ncbi:TonB-dependent receptor [Chroococcidiopsis sp. TS-821]|uniref:TonB-dependent receptor domain-containing protein n=1 Tax=Chroococcidiopsis sp. TS-821 TaxID=1378066 RepID=UPI000CEDD89C
MKLSCSVFWVILLNLTFTIAYSAVAEEAPPKSNATETKENLLNRLRQYRSFLPQLSEVKQPHTSAELLTQQLPTNETNPTIVNDEILIEVEGARDIFPATSTPVYEITEEEIQKQRPNSLAEVLRNLPGFAINDVGFGADIHTGTFYRGSSINQSVFLLNGRPINTNISTYHGGFDLNSIPVDAIERVELSSGTSSTLYGSEAFGGVVNIITKQGSEIPRFNGLAEFGSYDRSNYRASYGGTFGPLRLNFGYEEFSAENRYPVPEGAANRDAEGLLFNGDTAINNYYGSAIVDLDANNTLSLDAYKISSRRGLLYFGFPLQRDRLDHDVLNIGLSLRSLLGGSEDSILRTTLSYNQDYFSTYGPTQNIFYRQGILDSQSITARVEHEWQFNPTNNLRWGLDLRNRYLNGDVFSTAPNRIDLNETEYRESFEGAIFALNTWRIDDSWQTELGLRQNFTSEYGSYLNPSIGLRWAASPNVALRGSWVSVQRNPGLDQLYVYDTVHNWLPNPDLNPETGSSWTAGVDVRFAANLTGQFTYFGSRLSDRLGIQFGRWANIGLVNTNGLEAALRWQIAPEWSTFLNYTYTDAKIASGIEQGLQLGFVPYSVAQVGIGYQSEGWQVNLFASYFSGARRAFFNNPGVSNTDFSPSWLNFDLGVRVPLLSNLALTLFVENLADVAYEKSNRIYQPGRTYRIGITSNF